MLGRRNFLFALMGFGAALAVESDGAALATWLRGGGARLFSDLPAMRRLGALYLSAHPEERSPARLSRLLLTARDGAVPSRLLRTISRDWSSHHVVVVDGWVMARTEARLCAFLHLEGEAGR